MTRVSSYWKVPFRNSYCSTWRQWLAAVILCHVVYRLSPPPAPEGCSALSVLATEY